MSSSSTGGHSNERASALPPVRLITPDDQLAIRAGGYQPAVYQRSTSTPAATLPSPNQKTVAGGVGTLAVALLTIVTVFKVVDWSAAQTALVTAEAAAVAGLITALVAHLMPGRSKEPVALAATFTATVSATLALGSGFGWWSFTEQQTSAVAGIVTAVLGVGSALLARQHVTAQTSSSNN
jgi:hypothetical protein